MTPSSLQSIMVVDDDQVLREMLCRRLQDSGYEVSEASDGEKAISKLERMQPDVVLTDIVMPGREGINTIIEVRRRWPQVKIVAMSGGGKILPEVFLKFATDFGACAVLKKPFKMSDLFEILTELGSKSVNAAPASA